MGMEKSVSMQAKIDADPELKAKQSLGLKIKEMLETMDLEELKILHAAVTVAISKIENPVVDSGP